MQLEQKCRLVYFKDWGISSSGRAPVLQAGGDRFESDIFHQFCAVSIMENIRGYELRDGGSIPSRRAKQCQYSSDGRAAD